MVGLLLWSVILNSTKMLEWQVMADVTGVREGRRGEERRGEGRRGEERRGEERRGDARRGEESNTNTPTLSANCSSDA